MTDLMISPEAIDAYLDTNPPPASVPSPPEPDEELIGEATSVARVTPPVLDYSRAGLVRVTPKGEPMGTVRVDPGEMDERYNAGFAAGMEYSEWRQSGAPKRYCKPECANLANDWCADCWRSGGPRGDE